MMSEVCHLCFESAIWLIKCKVNFLPYNHPTYVRVKVYGFLVEIYSPPKKYKSQKSHFMNATIFSG